MPELIQTELHDRVMTLRLNRPDKKNALTQAMYKAMTEAVLRATSDAQVRALLITGSGDAFCAGNDLQDFLSVPQNVELRDTPVGHFMFALADCPKPVVAAVNGVAVGIGLTLLAHCDLVYAAEGAKFVAPFVNLGICGEFGSTYFWPRIMGHQRAAEILLLGEPISAKTAHEYGLVNAVLPGEQLLEHAQARAAKLAAQPPNAMRVTKQLMRRWPKEAATTATLVEGENFIPMLRQPEALEVMSAFMQKRKPDFSKFS